MSGELIKYQFRGRLDLDLLAKNMRQDKTPIVIVDRRNHDGVFIFILKYFRDNYKGENIRFTNLSFSRLGNVLLHYGVLDGLYKNPDRTGLLAWWVENETIPEIIKNIRAILKSHENASLPKTKVIGITTSSM